jgi:hypothetical protein
MPAILVKNFTCYYMDLIFMEVYFFKSTCQDYIILYTTQPFLQKQAVSIFFKVSRPAPCNSYRGLYSRREVRRGVADPSPPTSVEVMTRGAIPPFPHTYSWHGA